MAKNAVATYLALYIYAEIYQVIFTVIILYTKNIYHLISYLIFLCAMAVYSGIQFYELKNTLFFGLLYSSWERFCKAFSIIVIVLSCIVCLVQAVNVWKMRIQFLKATGEKVSNNPKLIRADIIFNLHRNALIIAAFFFPAFTLQFAVIVLDKTDPEFVITIVILGLSYLVLILADYCAARKYSWGLYAVLLAYMGAMSYLAFKIYRMFTWYSMIPGRRSLIAFDIFCIILLIWMSLLTVLVKWNFNSLKRVNRQESDDNDDI
ncbi:hypothetical protein FOA43_000903 [Brettanomyces nanus]|uniref:Uncharacterized protein n=1 Tax=Eeniella nana TaxID=13502 RepID=A0A875RWG1_EENNA|nr:uncharacterized protein FOA43_000903 [Brettanomyces nanus]QPG73591.1 hypothetical protein FOA43_000903 [Brettanomyces nanus]